jgi:uncharacterized Zn-binding protein involved in type VI secretion
MPPAARATDMHVCPMITVLVPHVGGPILPPCEPTVLIGFLPAARVTDMLTCVGPPDIIIMGSPTVLIGGLMAARLGDPTAHGGVIVLGCFTVMIGEAGVPAPPSAPSAPPIPGAAVASAPAPAPTASAPPPVTPASAAAAALLKSAGNAEPATTALLSELASSNGGKMTGLEFRLKTQESLSRKIADDSEHMNVPVDKAAQNIGDALRYTMILAEKNYAHGANAVLTDLEKKGHKVLKVKNTWREGAQYKGVNSVLQTPDGQKYELQFHTQSSFDTKQATHVMYEKVRAEGTPPEEQAALVGEMSETSKKIPTPPGVQSIKGRP